jgi:5-methylthioadenosine/S-adenosylhomocysteine deaminase
VDTVIDAKGKFVIPGLVQTHTHLCQVLFRGQADDMALIDWLKKKIWPMESAHTPESLKRSAQIGLLEMQLSGTTSILDMGTVNHTEIIFETARESGIRYWGGNCLMDLKAFSGPLHKPINESIADCEKLIEKYHRPKENIHFVMSPRFVVCCSEKILKYCKAKQEKENFIVHIHASENKDEIKIVKDRTGKDNIEYLDSLKLLNPKTVVVHGVHMKKKEIERMIKTKTPLVHCPSANLKLASGIAPIHSYIDKGMIVSLGSDGPACNNSMDPFIEMRLAALIQKPLFGPTALPATLAFDMATISGAKTLGMESEIGSLEEGKKADIVTVDRSHPSVSTISDPYSAIVYSCLGRDVNDVLIDGKIIVRNKRHQRFDAEAILKGN